MYLGHVKMIKKYFFCAFLLFFQNFLLFGQLKVNFLISKIPSVNDVDIHLFLAGDFNGWNPGDKAFELTPDSASGYHVTETFKPGKYQFKITRGSWLSVECNAAGAPVDNREIKLSRDTTIRLVIAGWQDNFKAAEKKHTASANVHILSDTFRMPQLGRTRRIWIYLPANYAASGKKYPVIYLQDGQNLFDDLTSSYGEWGIDEILDKLPAKDQCILIGIDHGGENRITEYDPYDTKYGKGRGDDYVEFLVKTLKPYIDQHYRTRPDARHTTIVGSSMGGLISMYAILKYPHVFGNAGIFSPAFWLSQAIYSYAASRKLPKYTNIYFVCGDAESDDMVTDVHKMVSLLRGKGLSPLNTPEVIAKGARHNEKQWNSDFPGFYSWVIKSLSH